MDNATPLYARSLLDVLKAVEDGTASPEDIARACLERIAAREADVGAWQYKDSDENILKAARQAPTGGLQAIPVGIKDIIDTSDMPTGYGSAIYEDYRPGWDASCVTALRHEGAVIFGKTVTTEFAYFQPGKTRNPHDRDRTPGGSSSGSAAAVADGHVYAALGTQTAGSVIRPAAFCGTVGYKPTRGLLDLTGVRNLAPSLDHLGVFTRTVGDAAYVVSLLARRPALAVGQSRDDAPRIGFCRTHDWERADETTRERLEHAARHLSKAGARCVDIELPASFADLTDGQAMVMDYEVAFTGAYEVATHPDKISPKFMERVIAGRGVSPETYDNVKQKTMHAHAELASVFADCDVLMAPSAVGEAPIGLEATGDPVFNRLWTLLGTPCVNVPGLTGPNDLPLGLQIIGRPNDDRRTLQAASWVQDHL